MPVLVACFLVTSFHQVDTKCQKETYNTILLWALEIYVMLVSLCYDFSDLRHGLRVCEASVPRRQGRLCHTRGELIHSSLSWLNLDSNVHMNKWFCWFRFYLKVLVNGNSTGEVLCSILTYVTLSGVYLYLFIFVIAFYCLHTLEITNTMSHTEIHIYFVFKFFINWLMINFLCAN